MQSNTPQTGGRNLAADPGQIPVIPLPNEGEGGPVYPGNDPGQIPVIPLPNPGEGGPVYPGNDPAQTPAAPLPGAGGPFYPGIQILPATPIYVLPNAAVRFVNAAGGYPAMRISIDGTRVVTLLAAGEASCYSRIAAGSKTVTVMGADGYIYLQKQLTFRAGRAYIIAIAHRSGGLDLTQAEDVCF